MPLVGFEIPMKTLEAIEKLAGENPRSHVIKAILEGYTTILFYNLREWRRFKAKLALYEEEFEREAAESGKKRVFFSVSKELLETLKILAARGECSMKTLVYAILKEHLSKPRAEVMIQNE